jgi:hypothetical protein
MSRHGPMRDKYKGHIARNYSGSENTWLLCATISEKRDALFFFSDVPPREQDKFLTSAEIPYTSTTGVVSDPWLDYARLFTDFPHWKASKYERHCSRLVILTTGWTEICPILWSYLQTPFVPVLWGFKISLLGPTKFSSGRQMSRGFLS